MWRAGAAVMVAWIASVGCAGDGDDEGVATVGDRTITVDELRRFVMTLPPGLRAKTQGQEARLDYLQTLIDRELMLLEAGSRGLDREPRLQQRLQAKVEERVLGLYRQRHLFPHARVTDERIDEYIADFGLDRERLTDAIVVATEAEAREVLADLEAGGAFQALARERTIITAGAARDGRVGYLNRATAQRAGIPPAVFDSLAIEQVSPVLSWGENWHVVRFVDDRQAEDESLRAGVHTRLAREERQEIEDQEIERLAHELGWAATSEGLALLASFGADETPPTVTQAQRQVTLFTFDGGVITIDDYLRALREHRVDTPRALTDSGFVAAVGRRFLQSHALLLVTAKDLGLAEEPEIVQWRSQVQTDMVLKALREDVVAVADSMATEEVVREYYEERREAFGVPAVICFDEVLLHTPEEAERIRAEIDAATNLLELSRARGYHIRNRRPDGLLCMKSLAGRVLPELWAALEAAPEGQLQGPVSLKDQAWSVFKVVNKHPARLQSFDEARTRARASVVARIERQLYDTWLEGARQRYEPQVRIYGDRLETALPEALLAGTAAPGTT